MYTFLPHIAFQVRDYEKALEFYVTTMGMEIINKTDHETKLRCGNVTFYVENNPAGATFLAFQVDNLEACKERLSLAGCMVVQYDAQGLMVDDRFGMKFYLSQQ
jgi:catechol 2,3-dioxygenase-like lactoylglutathione lyase family enzyme